MLDPIEGLTPDEASRAATTSRSCARTCQRCGRRSDAASARAAPASTSPTRRARRCSTGSTCASSQGEFVAIAGPNGGGKTTLLRLALGLERPTRGQVLLFGEPAAQLPRPRAASATSPSARSSGPGAGHRARGRRRRAARRCGRSAGCARDDREAVDEAIERVGLADQARRPLDALSGGQQQRAFIAKALAAEPRLLVLDEPTTGVDVDAQDALAALLAAASRASSA